jgi:hypothetical protein
MPHCSASQVQASLQLSIGIRHHLVNRSNPKKSFFSPLPIVSECMKNDIRHSVWRGNFTRWMKGADGWKTRKFEVTSGGSRQKADRLDQTFYLMNVC